MIAINFTTARGRLKDFCDRVTDRGETVIVTRKAEKNVVIISEERFNELEKAERNAAYLGKLERGLEQVHAGLGIVKTMEELEAMVGDGHWLFAMRALDKAEHAQRQPRPPVLRRIHGGERFNLLRQNAGYSLKMCDLLLTAAASLGVDDAQFLPKAGLLHVRDAEE